MKTLTHLNHVEDLLLVDGIAGGLKAIEFLGNYQNYDTKVKIDGSPSIVAGLDDFNNFFVSTKSFFNKTPVLNYSIEHIERNHNNQTLQDILKCCFKYLPEVIKGGVFQGDLLYSNNVGADYPNYVSFEPNTIEYRVYDRDTKQKIKTSKLGIAWHTSYCGRMSDGTFDMGDFRQIDLSDSPNVWQADTAFNDPYDVSELNDVETPAFEEMVYRITNKIAMLDRCLANIIFQRDSDISKLAMMFINNRIQRGAIFYNTEEILFDFLNFIDFKADQKIKGLTQESAIYRRNKEASDMKKYILLTPRVRQTISKVLKIHNDIVELKNWIIGKMERTNLDSILQSYIKDSIVGPEGYVIKNQSTNEMVKFVTRSKFSRANFENQRN